MRRTSSWRIWGRLQSASESGWRSRAHSPGAGAPRTDIPGASSAEEHAASAFLGRPQLPPPPPLLRLPCLPLQRAPLELDAKENPLAGNGLMLGAELTPEQDPRRGFEGEGLRYPATLPASEGGGRL